MLRPRSRGWIPGALLACLLVLAAGAAPAAAEPALPPGFQDEVVLDHLEQPTNFRFAPDGRIFVAEKPGRILVFENLQDTEPEVFADLRTDVYETGDRGLLGIALDPKFDEGRPYVYALYTYDHILGDPAPPPKWGEPNTTGDPCPDNNGGDACLVSGRLVRLKAIGDHAEESGGEPVQEVLAEDWCQQFSSHSIGDLQFGPEGALYVSGGDGASFTSADYGQFGDEPNPCGDPPGPKGTALTPPTAEGGSLRAQNPKVLGGKILRVDPDSGEGLTGNPLFGKEAGTGTAAENEARIVAEGFRNPFRFAFDPQTNELYTDNVGSSEIEEIDRFPTPPTGLYNSGWPCYEGPERQFQFKVLGLDVCERLYEEEEEGRGSTSPPFFDYSHGQSVVPNDECPIEYGSALGGISFYEGNEFPAEYKGALFFTDTVRGCVWVMFPGADGKPDPSTTTRFMRESRIYPAVDIEEGPEGGLYYADLFGNEEAGEGAIHRITYDANAPTAKLTANPPYGVSLPLKITFDASESTDPNGDPLSYDWDLDGNGSFETPGGETQTLEFTKAELEEAEEHGESLNKVVAVRVEDPDGNTGVARVTVYPGDKPPTPEINAPAASLKWKVGDTIHFEGSATDAEGHPMVEPLSYYWSTRLLHCPTGPLNCHSHPLQIFAGVRDGELIAPEHDYPSYIEITLRVADHRGLTASKTIKLEPQAVNATIASSPPGIELTAGLLQGPSPLSLTAIEGAHVLLTAPEAFNSEGKTYAFSRWSDGGERIHTIVAEGAATQYTAEYEAPAARLAEPSEHWNGAGELEVEFDASESSGEDFEYEWDPQGDGSFEAAGEAPTRMIILGDESPHTVAVRVVDSNGASDIAEETVNAVALQAHSDPGGLPLEVAGVSKATPFTLYALKGSEVELSAPETAEVGGKKYVWQVWSDSGERIHTIVADEATNYTATYVPMEEEEGDGGEEGKGGEEPGESGSGGGAAKGPQVLFSPPPLPTPLTSIRSHPSKSTRSRSARFTFTANQGGVSFRCKLDRSAFKACRSPRSYKRLRPGTHSFAVVAVGPGGPGAPAKFRWKVRPKPKRR